MKKIITYGTFDLFHIGHINLLKRAKEMGDYLIVAVSTDEFNSIKGKTSYFTYEERKKIVEAIKYVDEVIPEECWEQKVDDVKKYDIDIFTIGDDWEGKFDDLPCKVVYLSRTEGVSTTMIKESLGFMILPNQKLKLKDYTIEQKRKMLNAINKLQKEIPDYNFYISFGTLLGCVRDNGLIDHDNDIDISYLSKCHTAKEVEQDIISLYERLREKGFLENYRVREEDVEKGLWGLQKYNSLKTILEPKGQCQIVIDGIRLDTWTDWIDENGNFFSSIRGNLGEASCYLPLIETKIYEVELKMPRNAEIMLKDIYGDWETPSLDKGVKPEKDYLGIWLGEIA